jgi:pheromone shutdown protein TraB
MEENLIKLKYADKEIILVVTAHVLKQSAELVKKVIDEERPDSISVELDEGRYQNIQNPKAWENTDIIKVIKSKKTGFLLASLILGSFQKKIANNLDTSVGLEMLQGIESAREIGAELVLADRNIQITFLRIWRKLSLWEKCKLFFGLILSSISDTKISVEDINQLLKKDSLDSAISDLR